LLGLTQCMFITDYSLVKTSQIVPSAASTDTIVASVLWRHYVCKPQLWASLLKHEGLYLNHVTNEHINFGIFGTSLDISSCWYIQ